jgi:hypothetical protein
MPKIISVSREVVDHYLGVVRVECRNETNVTGKSVSASTVDGRRAGAFQFPNRNIVRFEGDYELIRFLKKRYVKMSGREEWIEFFA